ncbi:hypothetical protein KUTeg_023624 [Tegillarca granosa]|uniref:Elongator complex protein 4 n=1 Tax=Tegillarca granosa TaxID=220873 RepID=A0ABQ9E5J6_TEGGR|nr:hypothetical protein KUTeg_023624 [Tegillarca granosa]
MAATSFQKKSRVKSLQIPGAKPSLYNNQLLISTGIPSLDNVVGGGVAAGTIFMIEEDTYGNYSRMLLNSVDNDPKVLLKEVPAPVLDDPGITTEIGQSGDDDKMKIAWRYQHLPRFQSNPSNVKFGHYYDLTKVIDPELIEKSDCTTVMNPKYSKLLQLIKDKIDNGGFGTDKPQDKRNILRIAIHSLGSPLWGENGGYTSNHDEFDYSLPRFLLTLKSILRSAFAVCMITLPKHLFQNIAYIKRIEKLCDTVVELESFAGSDRETNPIFKEYHGLFHIVQLPCLNSLHCHMPDTLDLAFKLRRKKFTIEQLHLPPELSENASRPQEDPVQKINPAGTTCGASGSKNKLDF